MPRPTKSATPLGGSELYLAPCDVALDIERSANSVLSVDALCCNRDLPQDLPFAHLEGNSDAHMKASMMGSSVTVPVEAGRLALGTWQGIYFAEFDGPRRRRFMVQPLSGPRA